MLNYTLGTIEASEALIKDLYLFRSSHNKPPYNYYHS